MKFTKFCLAVALLSIALFERETEAKIKGTGEDSHWKLSRRRTQGGKSSGSGKIGKGGKRGDAVAAITPATGDTTALGNGPVNVAVLPENNIMCFPATADGVPDLSSPMTTISQESPQSNLPIVATDQDSPIATTTTTATEPPPPPATGDVVIATEEETRDIPPLSGNFFNRGVTQQDGPMLFSKLFGADISNGGFTVAAYPEDKSLVANPEMCVEVGLRARQIFPQTDTVPISFPNKYTVPAGVERQASGQNQALWNFEFSVNSDTCCSAEAGNLCTPLSEYTYQLCYDIDPEHDRTVFVCGDPIRGDVPKNPFCRAHFFGTPTLSANEVETLDCDLDILQYQRSILPQANIVQQSWNLFSFQSSPSVNFNPCASGTYTIMMSVLDKDGRTVAITSIDVITTPFENDPLCSSLEES